MQKLRYESLAQALGAFVAGEFEACAAEPNRLIIEHDGVADEHGIAPFVYEKVEVFDLVKFEQHLDGLLSDLVNFCMYAASGVDDFDPLAYKGPVIVVYATAEEVKVDKTIGDWQRCAQGLAYMQAVGA